MRSKTVRVLSLIAAVGFWSAALAPAWAEADDPKALAAALKDATATLQGGLKASEREGTPISAKFEIEDGKLYLEHTLPAPVSGRIGVWSKADSVVYFDDYRVTPAPHG